MSAIFSHSLPSPAKTESLLGECDLVDSFFQVDGLPRPAMGLLFSCYLYFVFVYLLVSINTEMFHSHWFRCSHFSNQRCLWLLSCPSFSLTLAKAMRRFPIQPFPGFFCSTPCLTMNLEEKSKETKESNQEQPHWRPSLVETTVSARGMSGSTNRWHVVLKLITARPATSRMSLC